MLNSILRNSSPNHAPRVNSLTAGCTTGWVNYANERSQAALEWSSQDAYGVIRLTRSKAAVWTVDDVARLIEWILKTFRPAGCTTSCTTGRFVYTHFKASRHHFVSFTRHKDECLHVSNALIRLFAVSGRHTWTAIVTYNLWTIVFFTNLYNEIPSQKNRCSLYSRMPLESFTKSLRESLLSARLHFIRHGVELVLLLGGSLWAHALFASPLAIVECKHDVIHKTGNA